MATRAIGVDIVEISRVKAIHLQHGDRFLNRVLTHKEQSYCLIRTNPYPSMAARVAAKEAVAKALGVGIGGALRWNSISVETLPSGAPTVILDAAGKKILKKLKAKTILLSLSHTADTAIAVAVAA